eukprot:346788-Chlamydomonas_euryale.AAC.7
MTHDDGTLSLTGLLGSHACEHQQRAAAVCVAPQYVGVEAVAHNADLVVVQTRILRYDSSSSSSSSRSGLVGHCCSTWAGAAGLDHTNGIKALEVTSGIMPCGARHVDCHTQHSILTATPSTAS